MPFYAGFFLLLTFIAAAVVVWQLRRRLHRLETRLGWYEAILRRAGHRVDLDDYIQYCLINEGRQHALNEYVRLHGVTLDNARRALRRIEAELRDA